MNILPSMEANIKMLYIIAHYEKGNYDLLPSLVKSTYHEFASKGMLYKFESVLLGFFAKKIPGKIESAKAFVKLKEEIRSIAREEKMPFEQFDYLSWVESKIQNRPFAGIVMAKAKR